MEINEKEKLPQIIIKKIFENLNVNKQLELNLLSKKFYDEIIPELMLNRVRQIMFDCSFKKRMLFVKNLNVYEINYLNQ